MRFLWMLANSALTSQPSSQDSADPSPDSFAAEMGPSFSRTRDRVGATIARAAAARFGPDSADNGLPLPVFLEQASSLETFHYLDVPLYHKPCYCIACVSVSMRVFCNNFCSVFVCVHVCCLSTCILSHVSPLYSLLIHLYGFVSLSTQLLLILFIYWLSPLLCNKLFNISYSVCAWSQVARPRHVVCFHATIANVLGEVLGSNRAWSSARAVPSSPASSPHPCQGSGSVSILPAA